MKSAPGILLGNASAAAGWARRVLAIRRSDGVADVVDEPRTPVDAYWSRHTVNSRPFRSARESAAYLEWRFGEYPLYRELMELWGDHEGERVLEYGCGPGDDLTGFLLYSKALHVTGVDISARALGLARARLVLHGVDPGRMTLVQTSDADPAVPFSSSSFDFVHCSGVLHHTSEPAALLQEFRRVLKPTGRANIMVYNRESVWFHLYTAYVRLIVEGAFKGLSVAEAFARNTDGEECPISRCYRPSEFVALAEEAGFSATFVGGYLSRTELDMLSRYREQAIGDERLADEHRDFLRNLRLEDVGLPRSSGLYAGIGGSYHLSVR
jgi:ubiquinone/menaquinone biosynthesis C-methylase UbiE